MSYDSLPVDRTNGFACRGHEFIRGRGGYGFYGSHFSHGYVYGRCYDLLRSFIGYYDIDFLVSPA